MSSRILPPAALALAHKARRMTGRDPFEAHRGATPLELLFDLTCVIAFGIAASQFAHALAEIHYLQAFVGFGFACFAICWAWINFSWFASAYDNDDWIFRAATMVQMAGVIVLAIGLPRMYASIEAGGSFDNGIIVATHHPCCPRHFMRLIQRFEDGNRNPFCLMYGGDPGEERPSKSRFPDRTNQLLDREARKLATAKRTEIATHWKLLKADNAASEDPVELPSIRTFYRRVEKMKMLIHLGRFGTEATRNKFELSKTANRQYYPLERVEMDEDKLDIIALLKGTRLWEVIHDDVRERLLELKDRFWASVAIDCGTRSILAFRLLDGDPKGRSGVATLHMAVMPKDNYARAAGTENGWIQHGIPQEVATDHGAAYMDSDYRDAVLSLCGSHLMPPTGNPKLRGRIERFFKTGKKWLRLFTGQTFSNPLVRGDYDAVANASMDFEELGRCLVRLIVDVYHLTLHRGLGMKPIDAWAIKTRERPVRTLTDPNLEGLIFGLRVGTRKISRSGVVCLGIPYYSDAVQALFANFPNREILVKANPYNLGLLGFRSVNDDAFYWVEAAVPGFDGVSAVEWIATKRLLDQAYSQHDIEDEKVIGRALTNVLSTAKIAEDRYQVSSHVVTKEDYEYFENGLFNGYIAGRRAMPDYSPDYEHTYAGGHDGAYEEPDEDEAMAPPGAVSNDNASSTGKSILGPSEGTFDPGEFRRRREEDGAREPLSTPPPQKARKPRTAKDKPAKPVAVADLVAGTSDFLPRQPEDVVRTAGRLRTFRSNLDDEEV